MIWYRIGILTCLPITLLLIYSCKAYRTLKMNVENMHSNTIQIRSLATETIVQAKKSEDMEEAAGILSMTFLFILCFTPKLLLLIYEIINLKWIQELSGTCLVPPSLFYGKAAYDLLMTMNASVSIYVYFLIQSNCCILNFWKI